MKLNQSFARWRSDNHMVICQRQLENVAQIVHQCSWTIGSIRYEHKRNLIVPQVLLNRKMSFILEKKVWSSNFYVNRLFGEWKRLSTLQNHSVNVDKNTRIYFNRRGRSRCYSYVEHLVQLFKLFVPLYIEKRGSKDRIVKLNQKKERENLRTKIIEWTWLYQHPSVKRAFKSAWYFLHLRFVTISFVPRRLHVFHFDF